MLGVGSDTYSDIVNNAKAGYTFRMCSLFREPAHFATYLLVPAALLLFKKETTIFSHIFGFFFIVVSIATLSSLGIVISGLLIIAYIVFMLFQKKIKLWQKFLLIGIIATTIALFFVLGGWNYFSQKTFGKEFEFKHIFSDSRLTVIPLLFERTIPEVIFGSGLAEIGIFMATFVRATYCLGLVGLIGLSISTALLTLEVKKRSIIVLFASFLINCIASEIAFGAFALIYLSFILSDKEENVVLFKKIIL